MAVPDNIWRSRGLYWQRDHARRWQGKLLDTIGFSPIETPSRVVLAERGMTLRAYGDPDGTAPALLIVPAPIKRPYIWDLSPEVSVIQQCLRHNIQVYMLHWEDVGADEQNFGLNKYADEFILRAIDAITTETGQRQVFLAGHSLGGTFVALFAALHHERVRGLVLLEAPVKFGQNSGAFAPLLAVAPPAQVLTNVLDNVPGTFITQISFSAAPVTFGIERWIDWIASLPDDKARQTHLRVVRWTLDEFALPRRLFEEVVESLYRQDNIMRGKLRIRGRCVQPECVEAPLLSVVDPRSRIVPPESILPFHDAVQSNDRQVLRYTGDIGVAIQHLGVLVGETAHRNLWPQITDWIHQHS